MRIYDRWILKLLAVFVVAACAVIQGQAAPRQRIDPGLAMMGGGVSGTVQANGTTLHYVRGGTGSAVILLHGFPEDWYGYHRVMAQLAEELHLEHVYLVGHDIGGMVAYAFVRRYTETCRGVMLLDAPVPGLGPWDAVKASPIIWHIHFQQTPDLPEQLIAGREAIYLRHFLDIDTFSDADLARYARAYAAPEHLRALLEIYRAFPANEKFNAAQRSAISVPLVLAPGENSPFEKLMPSFAEALRAHGCANVKMEVIKNSVHYVVDEQPDAVAELIERYASS
jgi:pimeloyl-ACP methyl ester carboxylesterase